MGLLTLNVPCAPTADPESGIVSVGFCASELTVTLPVKLPVEVGEKLTVNETLWPADNVNGGLIPEMLKPVPLAETAEMWASDPPVFFTVSVCVEVVPTVIFVNVMLVGFAVSVGGVTPVPDNGMLTFAEPLTVSDMVPLTAPAAAGSNVTLNVVLWFGVSVKGKLSPL